jgi:hypothetical protein
VKENYCTVENPWMNKMIQGKCHDGVEREEGGRGVGEREKEE